MPLYQFVCSSCGAFDRMFAMAEAPGITPCPSCANLSARKLGSAALIRPGSAAMRLIDATRRTTTEPNVVSAPATRSSSNLSRNPLHRTLPRP